MIIDYDLGTIPPGLVPLVAAFVEARVVSVSKALVPAVDVKS